jgi:hypothetical protein
MYRPDGGVELIVRDRKDKTKLRERRYWRGEIRDKGHQSSRLNRQTAKQAELQFYGNGFQIHINP